MAGWLWIYLLGYVPQTLLLLYASLGLAGLRTSIAWLGVPAFTLSVIDVRPPSLPAWSMVCDQPNWWP